MTNESRLVVLIATALCGSILGSCLVVISLIHAETYTIETEIGDQMNQFTLKADKLWSEMINLRRKTFDHLIFKRQNYDSQPSAGGEYGMPDYGGGYADYGGGGMDYVQMGGGGYGGQQQEMAGEYGEPMMGGSCQCDINSANMCPPGPPGPPGSLGEPGPDGMHGMSGTPGMAGEAGMMAYMSNCPVCTGGGEGPPGQMGMRGYMGSPGKPGYPAKSPPKPKPGPPGYPGKDGKPGRPGKPGKMGKPGYMGSGGKGVRGPKGLPGKPGYAGKPGESGPWMPPGRDGPPGPNGLPGKDGHSGTPGSPGMPGTPGGPGNDAHYCNCPPRDGSGMPAPSNGYAQQQQQQQQPNEYPQAIQAPQPYQQQVDESPQQHQQQPTQQHDQQSSLGVYPQQQNSQAALNTNEESQSFGIIGERPSVRPESLSPSQLSDSVPLYARSMQQPTSHDTAFNAAVQSIATSQAQLQQGTILTPGGQNGEFVWNGMDWEWSGAGKK